jgi:hypothetical protein
MKIKLLSLSLLLIIFVSSPSVAQQVFLDADTTGDAYSRITSKLFNYEVPDCWHNVVHMTEGWDGFLKKYVFLFNLHWTNGIGGTNAPTNDNDRCTNYDRQRTELKVDSGSPAYMQGQYGDTHHYRWKFKIDSTFQSELNFTHVHQIKAGDGSVDTDNPLMTLTPVKSSKGVDSMQLRYISTTETGSVTTHLKDAVLAPFIGNWVEAYETVTYGDTGSYSITIKKVSDETVLFTYTNSNMWMWRTGITFCRPKWGLYRSLNDSTNLKSETVKFADVSLVEGKTATTPAAPSTLTATYVSGFKIQLSWKDNSSNEDQFRINRSTDGKTWTYLATAAANNSSYADTGLEKSTTYYYQIRAENAMGNSSFSNTASSNTPLAIGQTTLGTASRRFILGQNYPDPFNPSTVITYSVSEHVFVSLKVYNAIGQEVAVLVNEMKSPGNYQVKFDAGNLPDGVYFYTLKNDYTSLTKKMILLK